MYTDDPTIKANIYGQWLQLTQGTHKDFDLQKLYNQKHQQHRNQGWGSVDQPNEYLIDDLYQQISNYKIVNYIDIGTGSGATSDAIADKLGTNLQYYQYDLQDTRINKSKGIFTADLSQFNPKSFHLATCFMCMHHMCNLKQTLKLIHAMLTSTGVLLIREHSCKPNETAKIMLYHLAFEQSSNFDDIYNKNSMTLRTADQWHQLLYDIGFVRKYQSSISSNFKRSFIATYSKFEY
jgi:ubiquinone/menaquinone biosynthesis C-methylase UbiE